jgi:spoIIIJ-associated protein
LNDLELDAEVMKVKERGDVVLYILKAKAPRLVIGKNGVLLESLQALAYMVANKDEDKWKKILIDVDHYRERREKKIRYEVNRVAYKVKNSGKPYLTAAYPPYDRRIIHMVVQEIRGVYSESEGTGLYKKIWIRPE